MKNKMYYVIEYPDKTNEGTILFHTASASFEEAYTKIGTLKYTSDYEIKSSEEILAEANEYEEKESVFDQTIDFLSRIN